jgi:hypothetical protein
MPLRLVISVTGPASTGSITAVLAPFAFVRGEPHGSEAVLHS